MSWQFIPQFTVLLVGQGVALKVNSYSFMVKWLGCFSEGITGSLLWLIGVSRGDTTISMLNGMFPSVFRVARVTEV